MAHVEVYSSPLCGFCHRAKRLLDAKGARYDEINVLFHPARKREMMERAGGRTSVPQIFIDGRPIGGCDELHELDRQGRLDALLKGEAA